MARARRLPDPAPEPSNVVVLRPGFALPEAPEPVADPPKKRGKKRLGRPPKYLLKSATDAQDLLKTATETNGQKPTKANDLRTGTGALLYTDETGTSHVQVNPPASANDPTFQKLVARLPLTKLRDTFPVEAHAHANMLGRAKSGKYKVDRRWMGRGAVRRFIADMGPCPESYSLDRKNPHDRLYGPGQCRWADKRTQSNNRRNTLKLTAMGQTRAVADWERITGQKARTIAKRYTSMGWTMEEAVRGYREGGRRRPGKPETGSVPTLAQPEPGDWPTGATVNLWEPAFLAYRRQFEGRTVPGLTRATLFAWVAGNLMRATMARLRDRYPGYDDPDATEPPAVRADREYALVQALEGPLAEARRAVLADPAAHDLLRNLRSRWPNLTNPARVGEVARHDHDD